MPKQRVELDKTLLTDLTQIISRSPLLREAFDGLPADQREQVEDRFLDLIWDTILSGAMGKSFDGNPTRSAAAEILTAVIPKVKAKR